jgi:hypothetical protein
MLKLFCFKIKKGEFSMKKLIVSVVAGVVLMTSSAFAEMNQNGGNRMTFEQHKTIVKNHIAGMKVTLSNYESCVDKASSPDSLKECKKIMKEAKEKLKEERERMKAAR